MFCWVCYVARCNDENVFLSVSLRAVCDRARSCSYAERIANCVFSTTGEGRDYERNWAGHHLPQPGWDHRDALYVTTSNALIHWNLHGYKIFWLPFKSYINSHNILDIAKIHFFIIFLDAFYENLKKLREEDDYIVKIISTPLLNRVSGLECAKR